MEEILGTYSALFLAAALAFVSGLVLLTNKPRWNDFLSFGVLIGGLVLTWVVLHPRQTPLLGDAKAVQEMIGAGKPVLLEFQSPYCIDCNALKPIVDGLEEELGDKVTFIRLNIQSQIGRELAPVYGFVFTPTFIFFDAQGNELWRAIGRFEPQMVRDSVSP